MIRRAMFAFWFPAMILAARGAETNRSSRAALTNFTPNLPIVYLTATNPIVSDQKVPCSVRMVLPDTSSNTNALKGVVRIHGASSQMYAKKSFGLTLEAPVRWPPGQRRNGSS